MVSKLILLLTIAAVAVCSALGSSRIVGGSDAAIENYPSVVQVEFETIFGWTQQCAGTILNSVYVLSAAHCFYGSLYDPRERRIRAGTADRDIGGTLVEITNAVIHPDFNTDSLDSDVTVVRLASQLTFGSTIQQATIIVGGFEFPANIPVTYVGWGLTSPTGLQSHAEVLQEVDVQLVDRAVCAERYQSLPFPRDITSNMICAGFLGEGGRDACRDDAGGPLFFQNFVIGIISWGQGCALADFPGVSTNVASFTDWIAATAT